MTTSTMRRLADARPEIARRPGTVRPPAERAALLASILEGRPSSASPYVAGEDAALVDLRLPTTGRSRRPLLLAAAALVVVAAIGLGLAVRGDDGGSSVGPADTPAPTTPAPTVPTPDPAPTPPGSLPAGFDPATASALFRAPGEVGEVVDAYFADRYDAAGTLAFDLPVVDGRQAVVRWRVSGDLEGVIAAGDVLLREDADGWAVVASTIDDIDLSGVSHRGGRVTGPVTKTSLQSLALDVLGADGEPVDGSPLPGTSGSTGRFGTAAMGTDLGTLDVDVPVDGEPVVLRAMLVGGSILGVAEVALTPPPTVVEGGTTGQDGWALRTERTLDGWCVGLSAGAGRVCTSEADELWPEDVWYLTLGPTVRRPGQIFITGLVSPEVASAHVLLADGSTADSDVTLLPDSSSAYLVATVPIVEGAATVQLLDADGTVLVSRELGELTVVGG